MAGSEGRPRTSFRTIAVLTLLPVTALIVFFCWILVRKTTVALPVVSRSSVLSPRSSASPLAHVAPKAEAAVATPRTEDRGLRTSEAPVIVIIIDDIGYDAQRLDRAMAIDPNLNFAVLPNSTRGTEVAERLNSRGFEILCHLPMEPRNAHVSPGANAVLTSMSDSQIATTTRENIAAVPYAKGVNNHMGSRATEDRRVMSDVMRAMPRGMYFIDSLTGGRSVAAQVAREFNVKTATRQVFLDDVQDAASVRRQLDELSSTASAKGIAIGIGHPHDVTLRVLAEQIPQLRAKGFRFARASEVVR